VLNWLYNKKDVIFFVFVQLYPGHFSCWFASFNQYFALDIFYFTSKDESLASSNTTIKRDWQRLFGLKDEKQSEAQDETNDGNLTF